MCEAVSLTAIGGWFSSLFAGAGAGTAAAGAGSAAAGTAASAGTAATAATAATTATTATTVGLTTTQALQLAALAASTAVAVGGQIQQSQAIKATAKGNARIADAAAQDALHRGDLESQAINRRTQALRGEQRSLLASKGLDLGEGTPASLIGQTDYFGAQDQATARFNAKREAWAIGTQNANNIATAQAESANARTTGFSTLLSGTASVASKWYSYRNPGLSLAAT